MPKYSNTGKSDDIRICIDMRSTNEAIMRERHPIPTVDEVLQDMNGSKYFSQLDLRWCYNQLELSLESRDITTFLTHIELFRFKRLVFGINAASEIYQNEIQSIIKRGARCGEHIGQYYNSWSNEGRARSMPL